MQRRTSGRSYTTSARATGREIDFGINPLISSKLHSIINPSLCLFEYEPILGSSVVSVGETSIFPQVDAKKFRI